MKNDNITKLLAWTIFIVIVMIFIKISNSNKIDKKDNDEPKINFITIKDGFEKLNKNNYEYNYLVDNLENKIYFAGENDGTINIGVKLNGEEKINYYIKGYNTYNKENNELVDIYEGINYNLLDSKFIYQLIQNKNSKINTKDKERIYEYNIEYEEYNINIKIYLDENNINEIIINHNKIEYSLYYDNIGQINKLSIE